MGSADHQQVKKSVAAPGRDPTSPACCSLRPPHKSPSRADRSSHSRIVFDEMMEKKKMKQLLGPESVQQPDFFD